MRISSCRQRLRSDLLWILIPCFGLLVWVWPIGIGGAMPVGGDVTQFSMGLMAVLSRALKAGRLPYWNDLWGFGFPGIGESQMGVFYPPHWLLYGLFPVELGYTLSLILHLEWGAVGTWWAARRFGTSAMGAALAAAAWSMSGFQLIHLSHQWAYTTGSWLPWAWGLTWTCLSQPQRRRSFLVLSLVLCLQLLPGHFQIAFITQLGVVLLAGHHALVHLRAERAIPWASTGVLAATASAFVLAAVQVVPTYRLARLASTQRDFNYLSGFAATPLHLISWVAPDLFERSPLWRPITWDAFHTSPEEYLGYIGLVPLFFGLTTIWIGWRARREVRALAWLTLAASWLSLGPYMPGFRLLIGLPGFSFFRAPARWTIAVGFALSVLAGLGLDLVLKRPDRGRLLRRFVAISFGAILATLAVVEGALQGDTGPVSGLARPVYEGLLDHLPWGATRVYREILTAAHRPNFDVRVEECLARQGQSLATASRPVFFDRRLGIYSDELWLTALLLLSLLLVSVFARHTRRFLTFLLLLTVLDLGHLGRMRRIDVASLGSLVDRSPVLSRLASQPAARTIDGLRNLPMVAGVNPISAYRTLDLPALESVTFLASQVVGHGAGDRAARLTGAMLRVSDSVASPRHLAESEGSPADPGDATVFDSQLAGWRHGVDWVRQKGPRVARFRIETLSNVHTLGWFIPSRTVDPKAILGPWSGDPLEVLDVLRDARPAATTRVEPERLEITFDAAESGYLIITQLADPQWRASLTLNGVAQTATISRAFGRSGAGGWQALLVPNAGRVSVTMTYVPTDVRVGIAVSLAAFALWILAWWRAGRSPNPPAAVERKGD